MKILIGLTYYRPHTSGLTIYAERLAKAFTDRGHQVTILTSHYRKDLPCDEVQEGIRIVRVPVAFRLSKGVVMPTFGFEATKLVSETDVIQLHLPQFDAAGIALRGRIARKPTVLTYHCDLSMPPGVLSWVANQAVHFMNHLAAKSAHRIVTYTQDYADHSPFLKHYQKKLTIIQPPVVLPITPKEKILQYAKQSNPKKKFPVIGMAARFATEKGVEILLEALPKILQKYPDAMVDFAGPFEKIIGEEKYYASVMPKIQKYIESGQWRFAGVLNPEQMAAFYPNIDCLVLPSLNSTEAFGLVQIEAMMNGKPVVASDLPGVRQPILRHNMGKIIPIGDAKALANSVIEILFEKGKYLINPEQLRKEYSPDSVAQEYEILFNDLQKK
jgi:glycosyltransferase involved in cell wall biosynthesis